MSYETTTICFDNSLSFPRPRGFQMFGSRSLLGIAICLPLIGACGSSDYGPDYLDEPSTLEAEASGPFVSTAGRFS
ncbi:MAG: hypothetical protein VB855_07835, partial [Pirellulaceae bacterium]